MYAVSTEIPVVSAHPMGKTIEKTWCAMIDGIIAYWVSGFLIAFTFGSHAYYIPLDRP